jgi:hypothetical protein
MLFSVFRVSVLHRVLCTFRFVKLKLYCVATLYFSICQTQTILPCTLYFSICLTQTSIIYQENGIIYSLVVVSIDFNVTGGLASVLKTHWKTPVRCERPEFGSRSNTRHVIRPRSRTSRLSVMVLWLVFLTWTTWTIFNLSFQLA